MSIKVVELFAGVGGFRVGLEACSSEFEIIWANQWEPLKKVQHAFNCYVSHFGESQNHICDDINNVKSSIPDHDMLVGGFPCQDYSVARTGAKGIEGKKGVLWWAINDIVKNKHPKYILLENVDRLLKSPGAQRGRDFGIILRCLDDLNYAIEWRVINSAEYGQAQRRRRVFIFAFYKDTKLYKSAESFLKMKNVKEYHEWLTSQGFFAPKFPVLLTLNTVKSNLSMIGSTKYKDLIELSNKMAERLYNSGIMVNGGFYSEELMPIANTERPLRDVLQKEPVDEKYFLNKSTQKWIFLKGAKRIDRIRPNGEPYQFSEGRIPFPDDIDKPSRTMLTSEGTLNRSTHVIPDIVTGRLRLLTPIECERLNGFPDNWTDTGMPPRFRYFVMGNALVVPIITKIGERIQEIL